MQKKEIKDAYPKKICHMLKRCVRKKRIKKRKMHTQRRYATCPQDMSKKKKRRKKNLAHVQEKIYKERDRSYKGVHPPSTKNSHTLAHLDQIV